MAIILCDLDGTLLVKARPDPPGVVSPKRAAINQALAEVCDAPGVDFSQGLQHGLTDWQISERAVQIRRAGARIDADTWQRVLARATAVFRPPAPGAQPIYRPLPGVPDVLHALREAGHVLGLVTGNVELFARLKLAEAGVDRALFTGPAAFGDRGYERADILRAALAAGSAALASAAVVLGDTVHDLAGARAVGLPFLGTGAMGLRRDEVILDEQRSSGASPVAWVADLGDPGAVVAAVAALAGP